MEELQNLRSQINITQESQDIKKQNILQIYEYNLDGYFPIYGDQTSCNVKYLLKTAILNSPYFKELFVLRSFQEVIDEIQKKVVHVEPWTAGSQIPSTAFCCLYKLMLLRLTVRQVKQLLDAHNPPNVRLIGALYVRYCIDPEHLYEFMKKYQFDDQEVRPSIDPKIVMAFGEFIELLIAETNYYQTRLPSLPIHIQRDLQAKILFSQDKRKWKQQNLKNINQFQSGKLLKILNNDEWQIGVLQQNDHKTLMVQLYDELKELSDQYAYVGYESAQIMSQQELDEYFGVKKDRSRSKSKKHKKDKKEKSRRSTSKHGKKKSQEKKKRSRSRSYKRHSHEKVKNIDKLSYLEEAKKRDQQNALSTSRQEYARRPTSYKTSLSNPIPTGGYRQQDRTPSPQKRAIRVEQQAKKEMLVEKKQPISNQSKEHFDKMKKLQEIYGDATQNNKNNTQKGKSDFNSYSETYKLG